MRVLGYALLVFSVLAVTIWLLGVLWIVLNGIFPLWIAAAIAGAITAALLVLDLFTSIIRHLTKKEREEVDWGEPEPAEAPDVEIMRERVNDLWHSWRSRTK